MQNVKNKRAELSKIFPVFLYPILIHIPKIGNTYVYFIDFFHFFSTKITHCATTYFASAHTISFYNSLAKMKGRGGGGQNERDLITTLQSSSHVFAFTLILCKPAWCSTLIKVLGEIFCRSCFAVIRGAVKLIAATIKNLREWIRSYTKFFYIDFRDRLMDDEETENVLLLSICQKHTISE